MSTERTSKEHGILYQAEMVRALLRAVDPKTQTRRVLKPQPVRLNSAQYEWQGEMANIHGDPAAFWPCPYGSVGDRLWVRETFYCDSVWYPEGEPDGITTPALTPEQKRSDMLEQMYYRADGEDQIPEAESKIIWRPGIHMFRWASRLTHELTAIRVERLQDISEADAVAEGVAPVHPGERKHQTTPAARERYRTLWNSINAAPKPVLGADGKVVSYVSYPWSDVQETTEHRGKPWVVRGNPFVWALTFKRVEQQEGRAA